MCIWCALALYHIIIGVTAHCATVHWNENQKKKHDRNISTFALAHQNWLMCFIFFACPRLSYWNVCNFGFGQLGIIHERRTPDRATQCPLETFCKPFFISIFEIGTEWFVWSFAFPPLLYRAPAEMFSRFYARTICHFIYESVVKLWFVLFRFFPCFLQLFFLFIWHLLNRMLQKKNVCGFTHFVILFCIYLQIGKLRE